MDGEGGDAYGNEQFPEFEGGLLGNMAVHEVEKLVDRVLQIAWFQGVAQFVPDDVQFF